MATSTEHWRYTQLRQRFSHWREALQVRRLLRVSQAHLCRSAFSIWCVAWQRNIERREAIEVALTQNKLRGALLSWRQNVVRLRMRQKKAVIILEHCHLKQTFKCWRLYTAWKGILKKKVLIRNIEKSKDILFSSFMVWKEAFSHRREQEKTKQLWSTDCARKYAAFWRLTCHKRQLYRLNQGVLRPVRENRILRSAFAHWVSSLECRHVESERADEMWERLKRSRLQFCFLVWQGETSRALLLKPLQRRLERKILSESLSAWRSYVVGKTRCRANFELFRKKVLKSSFESWRRQHHACLVAKQAAACASQGLLLSFLEAWRFLIERKRKSREFRKCKLTRLMFLSWRGRASFEMDRRARLEEEEASNQMLKHRCFHLWRDNSRALVDDKERKVVDFLRRQSESSLGRAFLDWRRHMHSTLVSRAYNKSLADRLVATLFWEWRDVTSCIVLDAVHAFSERIGLRDHVMEGHVAESTVRVTEEQDSDEAMIRSVDSVSFSLGSSARGLYGEAASGFDTDTDRMILLSGGLQASVNEYQLRCQRLKEMALLAIIRLKNWPVCLAFEQWREFTARERQLKRAAAQLRTRVATLEEALVLRKWRENYDGASLARKHRTHYLTATMFESLRAYKNHRKYLKNLKKLAQAHRMLVSGRKYFYPWLMRTQEQRKQKHILHLWSSRTAEEMQLLPLETQLTNQITRRSLIVCFTIWSVRYRAVTCIRAVVYKSLLSWVFTAWRNWAKTKHDRGSQCKVFQERTQTKLAFSRWRERLCQSREVARKHQLAWKSYLLLILQQWRIWAAASKQLAMVEQEVTIKLCRRHLEASFERWRSMAVKVRSARSSMTQRLTYTLFGTWRRETIRRREEKSHVLQCQVRSYTLLVERLFLQWRAAFQARVLERQERQLQAEEQARVWGRVWRQQAQKSRGLWLQGQLDKRKMAAAFSIWFLRLSRVHELNSLLQTSQRERDAKLLLRSVQTWRLQVSSAQAVRLQAARLTLTVLAEWRAFTQESRDRRIRGMALKKALQERSLHVYFSYWLAVTHTSQSIQQSVEKRILFRVLRAWRDQASSQKYLRSLYSHFRLRLETRMLQNVFQTLRCKADYCAGLQEIVLAIVRDKERATLKAVITVWRDRLDNILATRFYVHILTVRTARQWHRFVVRRHLQRQRDAQNEALATHHHGLSLCRKVFNSLKTEVVVSRHVQTRRVLLCHKYARLWQSRVDHAVTARTMEREFSIRKAWVVWRLAYSRRCVIYKVLAEENRHILRLIFKEWRRTYSKKFALPNMASSSYDSYLRPVTYFSTSSSQSSSSSATMSPSLLPVPSSQKRSSICAPSSPSSAAETSFGFRGGSGRRKQN